MADNEALMEVLSQLYKVLSKEQQDSFKRNVEKRIKEDKDDKHQNIKLKMDVHSIAQKISGVNLRINWDDN
ncbi:MAG TPA: hypothetical protein PLJ94_04335 [Methylotenera sp.]|nr:MAG: hypothetical protein BVN34_06380 [Proteobacteria bacterium ST_bin12]HOY87368.1 hypothetical protein [Methylotenera sp.]HPH07887.1 hypothetical protein [Methylotenera sp.]